jgi:hypothetical protein
VTFLDSSRRGACENAALLLSWILVVSSICSGLFVLWQSVILRSFYPKLFNQRPALKAKFSALDLSTPQGIADSARILQEAVDAVVGPMGEADTRARGAVRMCVITFVGAMLSFLVYALLGPRAGT